MQLAADRAGPDHRHHRVERRARELPVLLQLGGRRLAAGDERARHVGPAARRPVARPDVDQDDAAALDRPVALLVAEGRLRAVGDDRRLGQLGVVLGADRLHRARAPARRSGRPAARAAARAAAAIAASAATCARRMPASWASVFTRRRRSKASASTRSSMPAPRSCRPTRAGSRAARSRAPSRSRGSARRSHSISASRKPTPALSSLSSPSSNGSSTSMPSPSASMRSRSSTPLTANLRPSSSA